jgi:hypothetical protein
VRPKLVAITAIGSRLILAICTPGELADPGQVRPTARLALRQATGRAGVTGSLDEEPPTVQLTEIFVPNGPWYHTATRITLVGS